MKRGDIYYANLSPALGSEMDKRCPVLIVSNDANNRAASTVTILPLTSNVSRVYPFEVLLTALPAIMQYSFPLTPLLS
jgi:mRNA interferase MazF